MTVNNKNQQHSIINQKYESIVAKNDEYELKMTELFISKAAIEHYTGTYLELNFEMIFKIKSELLLAFYYIRSVDNIEQGSERPNKEKPCDIPDKQCNKSIGPLLIKRVYDCRTNNRFSNGQCSLMSQQLFPLLPTSQSEATLGA